MSKSIKKLTSVLFILQLIILYPHFAIVGKSWERSDLVGTRMSYDSASTILSTWNIQPEGIVIIDYTQHSCKEKMMSNREEVLIT